MKLKTTDLCDQHPDKVRVLAPMAWKDFGGKEYFSGKITTLKCFEDNTHVRTLLAQEGTGRVLVVDGGGSMRCALLGDMLADLAIQNHWNGILVYGCIRDAEVMKNLPLGIKALDTIPLKSVKRSEGQMNIPLTFGGIDFIPDQYLYSDCDGVIVSTEKLQLP